MFSLLLLPKKLKVLLLFSRFLIKLDYYLSHKTNYAEYANTLINSNIYPNPAINYTKLSLSTTVYINEMTVQIANLSGRYWLKRQYP